MFTDELKQFDPAVFAACDREFQRQQHNIELIASENIVSKAVLLAAGTVLTNKYAEGYSGKRYYGGCQVIDVVETIAIERAKELFGCTYANVQPHSGASANLAVEFAILKPGDTLMGMNLSQGGHLTHGAKVSFSILKSADGSDAHVQRQFFDYDELPAGEGRIIHTYETNGNPIPSFKGEPVRYNVAKEPFEEFGEHLWEALNHDNRVSLFVRSIDLETGETTTEIINRNK